MTAPSALKVRFVAMRYGGASDRKGQWAVYDVERASYPGLVPGFGPVPDSFPSQGAAAAFAQKLADHYAGVQ